MKGPAFLAQLLTPLFHPEPLTDHSVSHPIQAPLNLGLST